MIHVTERAREMLLEALNETLTDMPEGPELTMRLGPTGSGLGLFPDAPQGDDEVVEHEGQAILYVDRDVSALLAGKTIDVEAGIEGARFVLRS
jgi:Fe-S cluster assembly iron-binding protein IscA